MPRTIYKYPFGETNTIAVTGDNPVPLFVGVDPASGYVAVWVELDPDGGEPGSPFTFTTIELSFIGTGHPVPVGSYVGSCIAGSYVWHVYRTS